MGRGRGAGAASARLPEAHRCTVMMPDAGWWPGAGEAQQLGGETEVAQQPRRQPSNKRRLIERQETSGRASVINATGNMKQASRCGNTHGSATQLSAAQQGASDVKAGNLQEGKHHHHHDAAACMQPARRLYGSATQVSSARGTSGGGRKPPKGQGSSTPAAAHRCVHMNNNAEEC